MGSLVSEQHAFVILLLLHCCGIVFPCQASTSLSLHPDGLDCCTEPSLLMSWLGKWGRTNTVKCQKCQDPGSLVYSDAPPTKFFNISYKCTPQMFMLKLQLVSCLHWIRKANIYRLFLCSLCYSPIRRYAAFCTWYITEFNQAHLDFHGTTLEYGIVASHCEDIMGPQLSNHSPCHLHSLKYE